MREQALSEGETLAISHLNALEYCPRRFYYECALCEFVDNDHIIEGLMVHERSDSGLTTTEDGLTIHRRVWISSDRLRLSGFADVVEEEAGRLIPIEYKKGEMGQWLNDHVQLCAQALCLEEMTASPISRGYIFYRSSAHREEVIFSEALRQQTEATIALAFRLLEKGVIPPPLQGRPTQRSPLPSMHSKCRDCSLEPICLPREVSCLSKT